MKNCGRGHCNIRRSHPAPSTPHLLGSQSLQVPLRRQLHVKQKPKVFYYYHLLLLRVQWSTMVLWGMIPTDQTTHIYIYKQSNHNNIRLKTKWGGGGGVESGKEKRQKEKRAEERIKQYAQYTSESSQLKGSPGFHWGCHGYKSTGGHRPMLPPWAQTTGSSLHPTDFSLITQRMTSTSSLAHSHAKKPCSVTA